MGFQLAMFDLCKIGCQKCFCSLLLNNLMDNPLFNISLIFTPGVIDKAPKAIDSIGGGDFILTFETFFEIHSLINGICVPPPTKIIAF